MRKIKYESTDSISVHKVLSHNVNALNNTAPIRAKELRKYDLIQTLIDYEYACALNEQGYSIKGHIKIDTDMHRLGFTCESIEKIEDDPSKPVFIQTV